jgi:hypothetical protein
MTIKGIAGEAGYATIYPVAAFFLAAVDSVLSAGGCYASYSE